jgi:hypothetical protein
LDLDAFCTLLLPQITTPYISEQLIISLLPENMSCDSRAAMAQLHAWGLLTTRVSGAPMANEVKLSIPGIGAMVKMLLQGRKEVLTFLRRKKFKMVSEKASDFAFSLLHKPKKKR